MTEISLKTRILIIFLAAFAAAFSNFTPNSNPQHTTSSSSCLAPQLDSVHNEIWQTPDELKIIDRPDTSTLHNFLLSCKFNARRWIRNSYNPDNKTFIIPVIMHKSTDLDTFASAVALSLELQIRFNEFAAQTNYDHNFIFMPVSRDPIYNDKIIGVLRMLNVFAAHPITPDMIVQLDDIRDLIKGKFRNDQFNAYTFDELPKGIFPVASNWGDFNIKGWIEPVNVIYADHHDDQGDPELMGLKNIFNLDHHLPGAKPIGKPNKINDWNTYPAAIQSMGSCAGVFTSLFPVHGSNNSGDSFSRAIKDIPEIAYLLLAAMTIDSTAFTSQSVSQSAVINGKGYDQKMYKDLKNYFNSNMERYKGQHQINPTYPFAKAPASRAIKTPAIFQTCIGKNGQAALSPELQVNFDVKSTYFPIYTLVAQDNNSINKPGNILGFSKPVMQQIVNLMAQHLNNKELPPLEAIQIKGFNTAPLFDPGEKIQQGLKITGITAATAKDSSPSPAISCRMVTDELDLKTSQFIMMSHEQSVLDAALTQISNNRMIQKAVIQHFFVQMFTGPNILSPNKIPDETTVQNTLMAKMGMLLNDHPAINRQDQKELFHITLEAAKNISASRMELENAANKAQAIKSITKQIMAHFNAENIKTFTRTILTHEKGYTTHTGQPLQPELIVTNYMAKLICNSEANNISVSVIQLPTILSRKTFLKILQQSPAFLHQLDRCFVREKFSSAA